LTGFEPEAEVLRFMAQVGLAQKASVGGRHCAKRSSDSPNQFAEMAYPPARSQLQPQDYDN
jgi:hypothetical protein